MFEKKVDGMRMWLGTSTFNGRFSVKMCHIFMCICFEENAAALLLGLDSS